MVSIERLTEIARSLQLAGAATGEPSRHELPGGLTITWLAAGDARQLSLTRWSQMPSLPERELIRQAFGVPGWVTHNDYEFKYRAGWGIMRIKWIDSRSAKLLKMGRAHLQRGWSVHRVAELLDKHNLAGWNDATDKQLDDLLTTIYGAA